VIDTDRLRRVARDEISSWQPVPSLVRGCLRVLPDYVGNRVRVAVLRAAGWSIGARTMLADVPAVSGSGPILSRLSIGEECWFNVGCRFELNDELTIGDRVAIGHEVLVLTSSHKLGSGERRAGELTAAPVTIGAGAWIGARSVILPGVTIGAGAVVSAGSVVNRDVAPNTVVAGVPAAVAVPRLPR
jgi:maltose O-acetyltransferase